MSLITAPVRGCVQGVASAPVVSAGGTPFTPTLDYTYVSTMALGGLETFTRASAGWYFNSSGVLTSAATDAARFDYDPTTARTNLIVRSSNQDNSGAWTAAQVTVTADAVTDPLGTQTADTFTENTAFLSRGTAQTVTIASNVTQTFSVYARAGTRSWLRLMLTIGADSVICWFNLGTGTVGSTTTEGTGSSPVGAITDAGSGWYRCALTGIPSSVNSGSIGAYIRMATADNEFSYQGNDVGTLSVWGAQLELGASATAYIVTAGSAVTTCTPLGLLIEEARTNLALQSQTLDNASWTKAAASVTANAVTAPDGTVTADMLVEDNTTAAHQESQLYSSILSATAYTASVYAKAGTRTFLRLSFSSGTGFSAEQGYTFNLTTGALGVVIGTATAAIQSVGNGWYRCSITATSTGAGAASVVLRLFNAASTYAGDGTSGLYLWGGQLEAGSFASSYVPTTTGAVARAADLCTITPLGSWFNAAAGTILLDHMLVFRKTAGVQVGVMIDDGTNNNRIGFFATDGTGQHAQSIVTGGVAQFSGNIGTPVASTRYAVALAYALNDCASYKNPGGQNATDTSVTLPTVTQMRIGHRTTDQLNGWVRRIAYAPARADNSALQTAVT